MAPAGEPFLFLLKSRFLFYRVLAANDPDQEQDDRNYQEKVNETSKGVRGYKSE
jgi:hypothetical protein